MKILKFFDEATNELSSQTFLTLSSAVPAFNYLIDTLEKLVMDKTYHHDTHSIQNALDKLKEYYSGTDANVYWLAMMLDP